MQRKFALLTVLGALIALALPASSMAFMWPASTQFEIAGGATPPTVSTSLGSCSISKMTGSIPASPANETEMFFSLTAMTVGTCSSGTTLSINASGAKLTMASQPRVTLGGAQLTLKFSSLPGCKLAGSPTFLGIWSNGSVTPKSTKSTYHAQGGVPLTWSNDGAASCALAGKTEAVYWTQNTGGTFPIVTFSTVNNLTNPSLPVVFGL